MFYYDENPGNVKSLCANDTTDLLTLLYLLLYLLIQRSRLLLFLFSHSLQALSFLKFQTNHLFHVI